MLLMIVPPGKRQIESRGLVQGLRDLTWRSDDPGKGAYTFNKGSRWDRMK